MGGEIKYDWVALKKRYMTSDFMSVNKFMTSLYHGFTSRMREKTKGWDEERLEWREMKLQRAMEKAIEKESDLLEEDLKTIFSEMHLRLTNPEGRCKISHKDMIGYCELFLTLNKRPTRYAENKNINIEKREDPDELTLEEKESVTKMLENLNLLPNGLPDNNKQPVSQEESS